MRRHLLLLLCLLCMLCPAVTVAQTQIMLVTDLHVLAPALYEDSELFLSALRRGDGKVTFDSDTLLKALEEEALHVSPDVLVLAGDLTFNGEQESHLFLAQTLARIENAGIPVLVIPGNHDIQNPYARSYAHETLSYVPSVTAKAFREIYAPYLVGSNDPESSRLGGIYDIGDVRLLLLDGCIYEPEAFTPGILPVNTLSWAQSALESFRGKTVITVSHHSLISHAAFMEESYVLLNHAQVLQMLQTHNVRLHLSGHLHLQDIVQDGTVTDCATSAFCVSPHRYGLITVEDNTITYEAKPLCEDHLPDGFQEKTSAYFRAVTEEKIAPTLQDVGLDDDEIHTMLSFASDLNFQYFSGSLDRSDPAWKSHPAYQMWSRYVDDMFFASYLLGILDTPALPSLSISLSLD